MAEGDPDVTLETLHGDLAALEGEMRAGFADLKTTMITGFAGMPTRESSDEMVRLLREGNRIQEHRLTALDTQIRAQDAQIRAQHLETQQILHALAEGQQALNSGMQALTTQARSTSAEIHALIRRIDALIRGRSNGEPPA